MARSKIIRLAYHAAGIAGFSIVVFVIQIVASGVALAPIINRPDDAPRTEEAFSALERFCGFISEAMSFPFLWIRPGSILNGPQAFVMIWLFWGSILYFFFRAFHRIRRRPA